MSYAMKRAAGGELPLENLVRMKYQTVLGNMIVGLLFIINGGIAFGSGNTLLGCLALMVTALAWLDAALLGYLIPRFRSVHAWLWHLNTLQNFLTTSSIVAYVAVDIATADGSFIADLIILWVFNIITVIFKLSAFLSMWKLGNRAAREIKNGPPAPTNQQPPGGSSSGVVGTPAVGGGGLTGLVALAAGLQQQQQGGGGGGAINPAGPQAQQQQQQWQQQQQQQPANLAALANLAAGLQRGGIMNPANFLAQQQQTQVQQHPGMGLV